MADIIDMPKLSDTMTVGTLVKWLKKEGDAVKAGDMLAEVETDKATMELESFFTGTLIKIFAQPGSQVAIGAALCAIGKPGEAVTAPAGAAPAPQKTEDRGQKTDDKGPKSEESPAAKVGSTLAGGPTQPSSAPAAKPQDASPVASAKGDAVSSPSAGSASDSQLSALSSQPATEGRLKI